MTRQFVNLLGACSHGSQFSHRSFHQHAELKKVAHFLETHFRHKVSAAGHNFQQVLMVQAIAGLAERRAPNPVTLHDFFF